MLKRLQQKWKLNGWQLFRVITCFALAGSLTGYAGRKLMNLFALELSVAWWVLYILMVTLLWPIFVILVSIPFGQYLFFKNYLKRMGRHLGIKNHKTQAMKKDDLIRIAIFASGTGTNAAKIIGHFNTNNVQAMASIKLVVSNKPEAGVLKIADAAGISTLLIEKEQFFRGNAYVDELRAAGINFIVLAGFLWKIPPALIVAYPGKIVNIHPALLPKYGGKGMYGQRVHEAVIANKELESGISIHWVDELYDHGSTIFQARCPVLPEDTADALAARIHQLEHEHFPRVIEEVVRQMVK